MRITDKMVARVDYTLTTDEGEVLDSSKEGAPLAYLHGSGSLIPGLEKELEGKAVGDSFSCRVPAEEAYGERDEQQVHEVALSQFPDDVEVQVGMQFQAESEAGVQLLTVVAVEGDLVRVDANHPLAGVALNFEVEVVEVREATEEELAHGHAHGPEGHGHEEPEEG